MTSNSEADISRLSLAELENRGERMVPEYTGGSTFWEHVYRYAFACRFVRAKRALDVACGEGYGAAALRSAGAASVIGVDVNEEICLHARKKYELDARVGSAEDIPVAGRTVDIVVSFETIEHVPDPFRFLDECVRVLAPGGTLVISTPKKNVYSWPGDVQNPHHCSEMTEDEFVRALRERFRSVRLYSQRPKRAALWSPRIFAAEYPPSVTGIERLRRSAQFRLFPRAVYDPSSTERKSAVEVIVNASSSDGGMLNPYAVRPRSSWHREIPMYLIGTAIL